jgi:hypothetical protein
MDWDSLNTFAYLTYQQEQAERENALPSEDKVEDGHGRETAGFVTFIGLSGLVALSIWAIFFVG